MEKLPFYIVDVFAEQKYTGNQLAVIVDTAKTLSDDEMQQIAKEMNYSETTFILSSEPQNGGYDVRIFTPGAEVPFAGHPTLGTAYILQQEMIRQPVDNVCLNLKVSQIPVTFHYDQNEPEALWMRQIAPTFGKVLDAEIIAPILGLNTDEIDTRFPIEEVSTGLPFMIVSVRTLESVKRITVAREAYLDFVKDRWAKAILVFCPETYHKQNDLCVRVFVECFGIPEDPATGSGNGCLAGYLVKHRYFGQSHIDIRVEQGYEIGRPSLLFLKAEENDGTIAIEVGGNVIEIAEGKLV
jgi:trans-2,3-dihydro-3-hydroxyanthranilate isomerase